MTENPTQPSIFQNLNQRSGWNVDQVLESEAGVWRTKDSSDELSYPEEGLSKLVDVEDQSFWFRYRNEVILRYLNQFHCDREFWEVGAGNGYVTSYLGKHGYDVCAVEPDPVGAINSNRREVLTIQASIQDLQFPDGSLPQVGCFDVLEHIEDAVSFLRDIKRVLQPSGRLWLTVPAMQMLWSGADIRAGHYRRYSKKQLRSQLEDAGYKVLKMDYFMQSMVFPVFLMRTLARDQKHDDLDQDVKHLNPMGRTVGNLLQAYLQLEGLFSRVIPCVIGTSLIAVAEA